MTTEQQSEAKKLTIDDPIDGETLGKFKHLQTVRMQCAERLLDLEQEKVRTLRMAANVDTERQKLFESVLISRGLPPTFPVEVDANTGKISPVKEALAEMMKEQNGASNGQS